MATLHSVLAGEVATSRCFHWSLAVGIATVGSAVINAADDAASCMPPNARKRPIEAEAWVPTTATPQDTLEAIAGAPLTTAIPVLDAEDSTEPDDQWKRKKSRAYEAFKLDPNDSSRCICRSIEDVVDGGMCGEKPRNVHE